MTVAFQTFGCRLNRTEALDQEAQVRAAGHAIVSLDGGSSPDVIVVRGCSVTAKAERDCRRAIARLKAAHPSSRIVVAGCLKGRSKPLQFLQDTATSVPMRTSRAYLKVQDGCGGRCAFCIVPSFRGSPRSVPYGQILDRAKAFLQAGYRELVVTGCNLALYRDGGRGLADLLAGLACIDASAAAEEVHRVRLGSLEPGICDEAVLDAFAAHPNICRFLHLSVQSGSDAVLASMNRPYGIGAVDVFCTAAAARLGPRLALGVDIIAGFPGETDDDFSATREFVLRHRFSNLHVFPYSERPGTAAATFPDAVPPAVRRRRAAELARIGRAMRNGFAASFLGRDVEVCVERSGGGWTSEYVKCDLADVSLDFKPMRRSLVTARVVGVDGDVLQAVPRPQPLPARTGIW